MHRRYLALCIAIGCLVIILGCGAGAWSIQQGQIRAPSGSAQVGNLELIAVTVVEFSTMRPPRSYYTVWVALRNDSAARSPAWRPLVWARRLMRLELPPPARTR
ncbi:MAG TPA: hypothetical protein VHN11_22735 [Xanthobacteraceae bacterium]|jgi:hypothetical protein|nr:hypothetical protein [Xanthobacteraceae bacterium]